MKVIKINKCFEKCPHCTGPDWDGKTYKFTCQESVAWIDDEDIIPDWCPLPDASQQPVQADVEKLCPECRKIIKEELCCDCVAVLERTA